MSDWQERQQRLEFEREQEHRRHLLEQERLQQERDEQRRDREVTYLRQREQQHQQAREAQPEGDQQPGFLRRWFGRS